MQGVSQREEGPLLLPTLFFFHSGKALAPRLPTCVLSASSRLSESHTRDQRKQPSQKSLEFATPP